MSEHINKGHNEILLWHHLACPIKYGRSVFECQDREYFSCGLIYIEERFDVFLLKLVQMRITFIF